jgi:X-Pro dipeptidyl-peptidase
MHRVAPVVSFVLAPLLAAALAAQQGEPPPAAAAPAAKATHVFEDGQAVPVDAFKNRKEWIREWLFVETTFDSDHDGKPDRVHVDVVRPSQTESEGLKVPVMYESSPYFAGTGPHDLGYYHDVKQELGEESPPRPAMAPIGFGGEPGMIPTAMQQLRAEAWVPRGYAVVHSCSPGTGWSQGCASVGGANESLAPKAVIDWLCGRAKGFKTLDGTEQVEATWCTGKVGMLGTSYNGTLPVAAATTGVEGLVAIMPSAPATSWYRYYRSNGLVRSPGGYLGEDMDVLFDFIASCEPKRREWCIANVRDKELRASIDRVRGDYNEFWHARDYLAHLDKYTCPTLVSHGLADWNVMPEHAVELYAALKRKGVPCMIYLHQGGHGGDPPKDVVHRWFTHWLFGVDNGIDRDAKALIVREDRKATPYPDYPHPDAAPVTLHPQSGGNGVGALAVEAAGKRGVETLVDDVSIAGGKLAQAESSEHRLLYATPPLQEPLHLSGTATLRIRVAADRPAVNLSVWLVALPWTGKRIHDDVITRGWADPQNATSQRESKPLRPGQFVELTFPLQPDDQIVPAGERIGLMVFASDKEFTLHPKPGAKLTVDLDGTALTLPVVGGSAAFAKAIGAAAPR